jgi:hypothetical protein
VDEVLVVTSSRSLAAVHQQQLYVSISRGRERCQIFTDDSERLRSHVTHSSERLQAIIGSVTTSIAITAGGVALMVLPSLVVGNELLILGGVGAAVGVWFFAHRHGQLRGLVDAANNAANTEAK